MVTKRELLNNLSNIYKCKVSPGGTFSLRNFLFDERELSGLIGAQRQKIYIFSSDRERKIPQYREYPPRESLTEVSNT